MKILKFQVRITHIYAISDSNVDISHTPHCSRLLIKYVISVSVNN